MVTIKEVSVEIHEPGSPKHNYQAPGQNLAGQLRPSQAERIFLGPQGVLAGRWGSALQSSRIQKSGQV